MNTVAVVGLGYVGLPLAVALGKELPTIGFDVNEQKLRTYRSGTDPSGEVAAEDLAAAVELEYTSDAGRLTEADIVIVAVPTPIDQARRPDLGPLEGACQFVGKNLRPGAVVVFESTVYPGCTEEVCVPILEKASGRRWAGGPETRRGSEESTQGFFVGYSPERINPGDKEHRLETIVKVVSGDTPDTLDRVAALYERVVTAGVHRAPSIKVAEAAKVIENTQRDLNIALMNELALIFHELGIDTTHVLEAAGSKWNFLRFQPGLVGGHCIGVDPYYLTYKAESIGYHPQVILAGRRINDGMGKFVAEQTVKRLIQTDHGVHGAKVNVLGLTFKEDCPDLRNSRVADIIRELETYSCEVHVHDPIADPEEAFQEYGVRLRAWDELPKAQAVIIAVAHQVFRDFAAEDFAEIIDANGVLADVKSIVDRAQFSGMGIDIWRL